MVRGNAAALMVASPTRSTLPANGSAGSTSTTATAPNTARSTQSGLRTTMPGAATVAAVLRWRQSRVVTGTTR